MNTLIKYYIFFILLLPLCYYGYSQETELDSLWQKNKEVNKPLEKSRVLIDLAYFHIFNNVDSALTYTLEAKAILDEYGSESDSVKVNSKKYDQLVSKCFSVLGYIYGVQGNYFMATEIFYQSLKYSRLKKNKSAEVAALVNLTSVSQIQDDTLKALQFGRQAVHVGRHSVPRDRASSQFSFGSLLKEFEMDSAKYYLNLAEKNFILAKDSVGLARVLYSLASIEFDKTHFQASKKLTRRGIAISRKVGDFQGICSLYILRSKLELLENNVRLALSYADSAYLTATEIDTPEKLSAAAKIKAEVHAQLNEWKQAYKYHRISAENEILLKEKEQNKDAIRLHYAVEYETKSIEDSLQYEKEIKIQEAEKEKQKLRAEKKTQQQVYLVLFLAIALIFAYIFFRRLRVSNKQKKLINTQKAQVEKQHHQLKDKNQEILDSINYAKRIQKAILPPDSLFKQDLPTSFVLYKPKDIVAGDFYWLEKTKTHLFFAVADCTGHGVPGAMVSVICNNALNRSVREFSLVEPGKILDKTREIVIQEFEKSEEEVTDGMDIALCSLQLNTSTPTNAQLKYAGANNALWIIRKGADGIEEIKADKQPIGKFRHAKAFNTHIIELEKGDQIYIFSDGFADQFGGDKGKKFKAANFKRLLLSIKDLEMPEQKQQLKQAFKEWKGNLEQLDDVCVLGLRI